MKGESCPYDSEVIDSMRSYKQRTFHETHGGASVNSLKGPSFYGLCLLAPSIKLLGSRRGAPPPPPPPHTHTHTKNHVADVVAAVVATATVAPVAVVAVVVVVAAAAAAAAAAATVVVVVVVVTIVVVADVVAVAS